MTESLSGSPVRMLCGMRAIGGGYSALEKLCGYLQYARAMTENNFDKLSNTIKTATQEIAEKSMRNAVNDIKEETDDYLQTFPFLLMARGIKEASPRSVVS